MRFTPAGKVCSSSSVNATFDNNPRPQKARAVAALKHRHIYTIHDGGHRQGSTFW